MINQTIHGVDVVTWLVSLITRVKREQLVQLCTGTICRNGHSADVLEAEDLAIMKLFVAGDALISVLASTCANPEEPVTIEIDGTTGSVKFDARDIMLKWQFHCPDKEQDEKASVLMDRQSADIGGAKDPLGVGSRYHVRMLQAVEKALRTGDAFDLEGADGAFAGMLIRRFYQAADDPQGIRPKGFQA